MIYKAEQNAKEQRKTEADVVRSITGQPPRHQQKLSSLPTVMQSSANNSNVVNTSSSYSAALTMPAGMSHLTSLISNLAAKVDALSNEVSTMRSQQQKATPVLAELSDVDSMQVETSFSTDDDDQELTVDNIDVFMQRVWVELQPSFRKIVQRLCSRPAMTSQNSDSAVN